MVCAWIEKHCVYGEGDYFGQPVRLLRFQKQLVYWLYEYHPATGERRFRESLIETPKGAGKTPLNGWCQLFDLLGPPVFGPKGSPIIPIAAASFEQADLLFGDMKHACRESETLRHFVDVYDTEIIPRQGAGRTYRIAASEGTNDGPRPSGLGADEIHEWLGKKERIHLILVNGMTKRANSHALNTTTPGSDLDSLAGRKHLYGYQVNRGEIVDNRFLFVHYGAPDVYDLTVEAQLREAVLRATPAVGAFQRLDDIMARYYQVPEFEFRRYHLAQWTRAPQCWLPRGKWEACKADSPRDVELDPSRPVKVAIDFAIKHDSVAVVAAQRTADGRVRVKSKVWATDGDTIDVAAVENYLRRLHRDYRVDVFAYDPAYFVRSAEVLADEGLPMAEFSQGAASMVPACQETYRVICDGLLIHGDDPTLTDHVLAAVARETDNGWRLSKGRSKRKIDACIAMVMAVFLAGAPVEPATPVPPSPLVARTTTAAQSETLPLATAGF